MRTARAILLVPVFALIACTSDGERPQTRERAQAATSPAPAAASLEQLVVDLDGDGRPDSVIVEPARDTLDPGAVEDVQLVLSRAGRHTLAGRWDAPPSDFRGEANLVHSRFVYVGNFRRAGRLLFLFSPEYGCCAQGFNVFRVGPDTLEDYLAEKEFIFYQPVVPSRDDVTSIVGVQGLIEEVGGPTPEFPKATSYAPVLAMRLEETARIDTAATARLTRKELGGFAGVDRSDRYRSVRRADSTRAVWDDSTGRVVP